MTQTRPKPHGEVRQSQIVTTFGPGSLLDLPNHSVIVGGLDHWSGVSDSITEPRLIEKLKRLLDVQSLSLFAPPRNVDDKTGPLTGITAWQFPEWFITQDVEKSGRSGEVRSRLLVHRTALTKGMFIDIDKKKHTVVPIRFVRACRRGHIGDIDWYAFVHGGRIPCRRQLWIDERGTTGDLSEIVVRCECKKERRLSEASEMGQKSLGLCDGARPWLGRHSKEDCNEPNRLLVRSASNAYFPQVMSVISLPDRNETLKKAVNQLWQFLETVEAVEDVKSERKKTAVKKVLEGFTDEEVLQEILNIKGLGEFAPAKSVKQAEFEVLTNSKEEIGQDTPDGNFFARSLPRAAWDRPWMASVERVVLVHRLREVVAQIGFTRFEAITPDVQGELQMGVQAASLTRELNWRPAIENRGEGIFLQFRKEAMTAWLGRPAVIDRGNALHLGFWAWQQQHPNSRRQFPELPYYFLHSLSHLLLTVISLDCGYPASSIRERVYALQDGYGILLYTGSPDAEGTLGGLVEAGRQIDRYVRDALELGKLCSNDPVCAQHDPRNAHEARFLHGAACHGCLLIAETSCEQQNDFLDRALLVATVEDLHSEFFGPEFS